MIIRSSLARKYARSLADVATGEENAQQVLEELRAFGRLLEEHRSLWEALSSPAVPLSAKNAIVKGVGELASFQTTTLNFLYVVLEKSRILELHELVAAFERVLDEQAGIVRVEVFSSNPLRKALKARLEKAVSGLRGSRVKLECQVDKELLGGLKLQIGSEVLDGTLRGQLETIRRQLIEKGI
ncbi:MAG TPA: ATP synthase F1 subunit delta [Acidobacteriota bacterium]|nr:ATP synthase F1 subunit delta [Acidobacteriota bacterium]